ncbi:MAG: AMP-binding protein [Flavobacteriales bacterium]
MLQPFDAITIDGRPLKGEAIIAYARELHGRVGSAWTRSILELFEVLVGKAPLPVRTSGTTGVPKRIDIQREDLVASAELTATTFGLKRGDRALLCLPCEFIAGKMMVVRAMVLGLDLHIVEPEGSVLAKLNSVDRFRFAAMVPQQLHRALRDDRLRVEQQFDMILLGGGPVSDELIADVSDFRTKVFQGYGSTETVTHVALRRLSGAEHNDHFTAIGAVTFAVDARGCLITHTPHLSTRQHITNDLVELIDATHFRWLGRFDNVILSGGKKIFPEQLEARTAAILPYPHYFTSTPDAALGQALTLLVESAGDEEAATTEAMELLRPLLDRHELPRVVRIVPKFTRTGSGKIVRNG